MHCMCFCFTGACPRPLEARRTSGMKDPCSKSRRVLFDKALADPMVRSVLATMDETEERHLESRWPLQDVAKRASKICLATAWLGRKRASRCRRGEDRD